MKSTNQQKHQSLNPLRKIFLRPFQRHFLQVIDGVKVSSILEVGAGEGFVMSDIHQRWPTIRLRGLDVQPEFVAEGKRLFPGLDLQVGDIYHLPETDHSWDLVIASEVLEHLERPDEGLTELRRVSRKYVLLSVPHEPWFRTMNFARGQHWSRLGNHPEHVNLWTRKSFTNFVAKQLHVESVITAFPWTIVLARV